MSIRRVIATKADIEPDIIDLFGNFFGIDPVFSKELYTSKLEPHIHQLIDDASFFVEALYIDKVYRDSYYNYFSSKLGNYKKDCIRISIFKGAISEASFRNIAAIQEIKKSYLGFIVLRPTPPNIIGRSVISPKAVKHAGFLALTAHIPSTANSVKVEIDGFPHSSQDTETITCAETSIWALMEYFGYKYAEYKPVLPSDIIEVLKKVSSERQIPSKGLNIQQMSYALKEFGFGTRIYGKTEFGTEFKKLFSTYIESGIPIIVAVTNTHLSGNIGHAILTIGHERTTDHAIDTLPQSGETDDFIKNKIQTKNIQFYNHDEIDRKYVFIDDNMPAYCMNKFDTPTAHYPSPAWQICEITAFIVPLYPKIYLEAYEAKIFSKQVLLNAFNIPDNKEIYFKYFLTSSRSYKHYISQESNIQEDIREIILETEMSKFVWVAEISNKTLIKQRLAEGFIIIDATEANIMGIKPLIMAVYNGEMLTLDSSTGNLRRIPLPLPDFFIFTNNLKGF